MKEATGELNMTVITVVAIAAVAALFYAFLWPNIKTSIQANSICANGQNYSVGNSNTADYIKCGSVSSSTGKYTCEYNITNDAGTGFTKKTVECKVK